MESFANISEEDIEYNRNSSEYREVLRGVKEDFFDFWFAAGTHKIAMGVDNEALPMLEICVELSEKMRQYNADETREELVCGICELIESIKED